MTETKTPSTVNSQPGSSFEERLRALEERALPAEALVGRLQALEERIVPDGAKWSDMANRLRSLEERTLPTDALVGRVRSLEERIVAADALEILENRIIASSLSPEQLAGVRQTVLNLSNIFLRTGNHEVRTAVKEIARGFCFVIGESHAVFFPDSPTSRQAPEPNAATVLPGAPGPGFPMAAQAGGMPAALAAHAAPTPAPGISVPGMAPSPFAIPSQNDPQGSSHPVMGSPASSGGPQAAPGECRMEVVSDPAGQMGPNGGPPAGTPGFPGHVPMPAQPPGAPVPMPAVPVQAPPHNPAPPAAGGEAPAVTLDQLAAQFSPMRGDSQ